MSLQAAPSAAPKLNRLTTCHNGPNHSVNARIGKVLAMQYRPRKPAAQNTFRALAASVMWVARDRSMRRTALIDLPSPLAGEGCSAVQQREWVRGRRRGNPSPVEVCWTSCGALSRKGRGCHKARRVSDGVRLEAKLICDRRKEPFRTIGALHADDFLRIRAKGAAVIR
jgi:hypothetical protein